MLTSEFLGFIIAFLILGALINILAKDWYRYLGFGLLVFFALTIFQSRYTFPSIQLGRGSTPTPVPAQTNNSRIATPQNTGAPQTTPPEPATATARQRNLSTGGPVYDPNYGGPIYGDGPYYEDGYYYENGYYYPGDPTLRPGPVRALW